MRRGVYNDPTDPITIENHLKDEHDLDILVERTDELDLDLNSLEIDETHTVKSNRSTDYVDVAINLYGDTPQAIFNYEDGGKIITGVRRNTIPKVIGEGAVEYFTSDL